MLGKRHFCLQRALFNQITKVTRDCFDFHLLRSVIGLENSRHPLNQSNAKITPMVARVFPRFSQLAYFYSEFLLAHFGSTKLDRNQLVES